MRDDDEVGRGGKIAIPEIVMHSLEVPAAFSRLGVEREQRVREEVSPQAIAAIKIGGGRASRDVDDAACSIHRHARPRVRATGGPPGVLRPCVVAEFARVGNGVERPTNLPVAHVVRTHVARRRALFLADARSPDEDVLVDDTRTGRHQVCIAHVASEARAEVHGAGVAEGGNRMTGPRIERVQPAAGGEEDAPVATISPVHDAAVDV